MKRVPILAGLLTSLLLAALTIQVSAQTAQDSHARTLNFGYDKAHEITLEGTIQEVISQSIPGTPGGMHLLVAGSQGIVDAHLGPYVTKDTQEALHTGTPVQIVGAMEKVHGKDLLLARQVIFGGRLVTVRTKNGFLARARSLRQVRPTTETVSQVQVNGGAR